MGVEKKIGISKEERLIAVKYASRFRLHDYKLVIGRSTGHRILYLEGTSEDDLEYRIRFDKVKKMSSPKGIQITNKLFYLKYQCDKVHGLDKYDLSGIKEEEITFSAKLPIKCHIHGLFYKRKAALITDSEGCPKCSKNRFNNNRKYYKYESRTDIR